MYQSKNRPDCVIKQLRLWWIANFLRKTLCQTPIDAKSRGSSFCRKDPLNRVNWRLTKRLTKGLRSSVFGLRNSSNVSVYQSKNRPDCVIKQLRLWWIANFLRKTLCQTPIDAKSRGSSFCRKDPLNRVNWRLTKRLTKGLRSSVLVLYTPLVTHSIETWRSLFSSFVSA